MKTSRAPLTVAIVLLLLPVLYVGSYLALMMPGPGLLTNRNGELTEQAIYRLGSEYCRKLYWPLEQIDQKVRPSAWVLRGRRHRVEYLQNQ